MHEFVQQLVRLVNKDQSTPNIEQPHLFEWLQQPQLRTVTGLSKGEPMPVTFIPLYIAVCCGCSCGLVIGMGCGTIWGGGIESTARMTGDVDCEYEVVT